MKKNVVSVDLLNWISVLIVLNLSLSWSSEGSSEHQMTIRAIFFKKLLTLIELNGHNMSEPFVAKSQCDLHLSK